VEFFASRVAPFPYERLAHVQSSTRFGGMENATIIFYSDRAFREGTLDTGLIAHETAHQWFGDAVTEREWSHLWLSEGFATYFAQLWVEHSRGPQALREGMAEIRREILESEAVAERPVIDTAQTDYLKLLNENSYEKGGWVLHMLRTQVGDSAFFAGVRDYYVKNRHGTALTEDLVRSMEAASGQELDWFFDQWLRRPGYPQITSRWRYDAASRGVVLEIDQAERFGAYRFPLEIEVEDAAGRRHRGTIEIPAERSYRITLPMMLDAAPSSFRLDPDGKLLAQRTDG
jgi:aminopeptidase N